MREHEREHELERIIGYKFHNIDLLTIALTHTSYANESKEKVHHNERLEFLGDSVLSVVTADYLFHAWKDRPEGDLSRTRASLVSEGALFQFAQEIELGSYLRLGRGEDLNGGRNRPSVVSDAFEAVIAALYLDGGIEVARRFILPFITEGKTAEGDYKTRLQEVVQQNPEEHLHYELEEESGPDHDKHFVVAVYLNANCIGRGHGHSKKMAEQHAAREALALMGLKDLQPQTPATEAKQNWTFRDSKASLTEPRSPLGRALPPWWGQTAPAKATSPTPSAGCWAKPVPNSCAARARWRTWCSAAPSCAGPWAMPAWCSP